MSSNQENRSGGLALTLTIIAALTGGYFLFSSDLQSLRPNQTVEYLPNFSGTEFVRTRLWQDPWGPVTEHWRQLMNSVNERQRIPPSAALPFTISKLPDALLAENKKNERTLRFFVLLNSGPYAEDFEQRRRQRYALVSALTDNDYVPIDEAHAGYFLSPQFKESGPASSSKVPEICNSITSNRCPISDPPLLVGYETFVFSDEDYISDYDFAAAEMSEQVQGSFCRRSDDNAKNQCNVHVYWLSSADFGKSPIAQVTALINVLDASNQSRHSDPVANVIIGPSSSTGMVQMVEAAQNGDDEGLSLAEAFAANALAFPQDAEEILLAQEIVYKADNEGTETNVIDQSEGADLEILRSGSSGFNPSPESLNEIDYKFIDWVSFYLDDGLNRDQEDRLRECLLVSSDIPNCLDEPVFGSIDDWDESWRKTVVESWGTETEGSTYGFYTSPETLGRLITSLANGNNRIVSLLLDLHKYLDRGLYPDLESYPANFSNCLQDAFDSQSVSQQLSACISTMKLITDSDSQWYENVPQRWTRSNSVAPVQTQAPQRSLLANEFAPIRENLVVMSNLSTGPLDRILARGNFEARNLEKVIAIEQELAKQLRIKSFRSVLTRDDLVLRNVILELSERIDCDREKPEDSPEIVVISEQDTIYGRLVDDIVEVEIDEMFDERVIDCKFTISEFGYLRGVDGETSRGLQNSTNSDSTDRSPSTGSDNTSFDALLSASGKESEIGPAQFDYVSRLALEIQNWVRNDSRDIVAVGVLGSDVYDKLLIIQALKTRLPSSVFFTTDLDTRFYGSQVYNWTRNLLVSSSYGLKIEGQETPAFRDSYQTALYRAVDLSTVLIEESQHNRAGGGAGETPFNFHPPRPQLFEIARSGPINIQNQPNREYPDDEYSAMHGEFQMVSPRKLLGLFDERHWFALPLYVFSGWILFLAGAAKLRNSSIEKRYLYPLSVFLGLSIVFFSRILFNDDISEEPLYMFEGVSSIPTYSLQIVTSILAIGFTVWAACRIHAQFFALRKETTSGRYEVNLKRDMADNMRIDEFLGGYLTKKSVYLTLLAVLVFALLLTTIATLLFAINSPEPELIYDPVAGNVFIRVITVFLSLITLLLCVFGFWQASALVRKLSDVSIIWWTTNDIRMQKLNENISDICLKMNLMVRISETVNPLVYPPCLLFGLLLIARSTLFEGWVWTPGILLLYSAFILLLLHSALAFQTTAIRSRDRLLQQLRDMRVDYVESEIVGKQLELAIDQINHEHGGAFVHWTEHPILKAIALPSGSIGLLALFFQ